MVKASHTEIHLTSPYLATLEEDRCRYLLLCLKEDSSKYSDRAIMLCQWVPIARDKMVRGKAMVLDASRW